MKNIVNVDVQIPDPRGEGCGRLPRRRNRTDTCTKAMGDHLTSTQGPSTARVIPEGPLTPSFFNLDECRFEAPVPPLAFLCSRDFLGTPSPERRGGLVRGDWWDLAQPCTVPQFGDVFQARRLPTCGQYRVSNAVQVVHEVGVEFD